MCSMLSIMVVSVSTLPLLEFALTRILMSSIYLKYSKAVADCSTKDSLNFPSRQVMKWLTTPPATLVPIVTP